MRRARTACSWISPWETRKMFYIGDASTDEGGGWGWGGGVYLCASSRTHACTHTHAHVYTQHIPRGVWAWMCVRANGMESETSCICVECVLSLENVFSIDRLTYLVWRKPHREPLRSWDSSARPLASLLQQIHSPHNLAWAAAPSKRPIFILLIMLRLLLFIFHF